MYQTKYLIQRLERLEELIEQPSLKCKSPEWKWSRDIVRQFLNEQMIEIKNELLQRKINYVEFRQTNVEGLYAKTKRKKSSFG